MRVKWSQRWSLAICCNAAGSVMQSPFGRRRWAMMLITITPSAIRKNALAMTLTWGGTETRAAPQTKSGNVCVPPELKYVTTKSSTESAKPRSAALRIAGARSGSVILRKVTNSFAPRSIAASSRCRSNPTSRAFTVTTM